jgi:hypothetical protein
MSAPVNAAIARDTLVEAGVVVWIGTSVRELSLSAPASTFEMCLCFPSLICVDSIFISDKRSLTVYNI